MPINTDFTVHADSKPQILRLIIRNHILLLKAAMPMYIHEHEEWCCLPFRGTNDIFDGARRYLLCRMQYIFVGR